MDTSKLRRFAQYARRSLIEQVSTKLEMVLVEGSAPRRENPGAVDEIKKQIKHGSRQQLVERVAYTWFNRFCALRFMDVNHYTRIGIVSPTPGQFQPEILAAAKMGHIDEELVPDKRRRQIFDLLSGTAPSRDPQGEAYRLLVVAACNHYHRAMPYLFESIADYTELLMPDDLLSGNSILAYTREAMTPEACEDVEVIGWLYQFYVSEKKDDVFEGLKQGRKISERDIPAATQLFTPDWIVRFLVDNSLGRLWMLNRPQSQLIERMSYYIRPERNQAEFLRVASPEDLRVGDSAVGAAHMLTYAFDLLYEIYEEEGYNPPDIPRLILEKNLYGIEIDERAGALAAFALTMKACAKDRRFLKRGVSPNICVLHSVLFTESELASAPWRQQMARNLIDLPLLDALTADLRRMDQASLIGSLLRPQLTAQQIADVRARIDAADNLFAHGLNERVLDALGQLEYLARHYHVVVANPPYMGGKGMNDELKQFLNDNYPDVKSDLFSAFVVRNLELALRGGQLGFMTPFVWMFISSYEKLREFLIDQKTITTLVQLEYSGFEGATVPICTFTLENAHHPDFKGGYIRLSDFRGANNQAPKTLEAVQNPACGWFYRSSAIDFKKIPSAPIAYWVSEKTRQLFVDNPAVADIGIVTGGMTTGDNDRFLRLWHEVALSRIGFGIRTRTEALNSRRKWFPYNKGGAFRKWFGNREYVVNWFNDGEEIVSSGRAYPRSRDHYFRPSLTYTATSSSYFGIRYSDEGFIFDAKGSSCFFATEYMQPMLGFLASKIASGLLKAINPTIEFQTGNLSILPFVDSLLSDDHLGTVVENLIDVARNDWDSYETSWDFADLPLLRDEHRRATLAESYASLRSHWHAMTQEMQRLEEENNRIFIAAYGLQDELKPEVPPHEITLTCNPHYRYNSGQSAVNSGQSAVNSGQWSVLRGQWPELGTALDEIAAAMAPEMPGAQRLELELRLLADTMREFASYAVGCMFGRYSLDKPGLILANQGETVEDYVQKVARGEGLKAITFMPDSDNVLPILDGEWFEDDVVDRLKLFLRLTFGEAHYTENLAFLEQALGRDLRGYFLRDFYDDHVKRYQKRPIYWLFSSPKGSFNALIYMHRYRPDTVSVVLNEYLRNFHSKLVSHKRHLEQVSISAAATARDKTVALREIDRLGKVIAELTAYENEVLYPLATQQVAIDLNDGVKVNYTRLGKALRKITGVSA
jgi:type II restriction/modification system DNA methylase subunit YeeA